MIAATAISGHAVADAHTPAPASITAMLAMQSLRVHSQTDIADIRAFGVHAKDDAARAFYEHFGFVASSSDPFHLFVLMKDLRRIAGV